jgi:HD-GYP domain-containing protein (c-di-GMP phosphodiesterase class II)
MQGFLVQSNDELMILQQLCDTVYVDTEKSLVSLKKKQTANRGFRSIDLQQQIKFPPAIDRQLAATGLKNALPIYTHSYKTLKASFKQYRTNLDLKAAVLEQQVDSCLNAILSNTTAMSWLTRVKTHSNYISEHAMHVSLLAMVFAVHCGWRKEEAREAGLAGLLFDLGKIRIPKQILNKAGPLNESEILMVREHTKWGRYYLETSGFSKNVVDAAYYHHERPDGNGYPTGRVGSQVPLMARLIRILDAYDAMISGRPYAETPMTVFNAVRTLYRGRGTLFDSQLVDLFIGMTGVYPAGTVVELSSGEIAVVIGQNNGARLLPRVSVIRNRNKEKTQERPVNLFALKDKTGRPTLSIKRMLNDGSYGVYLKDYTRSLLIG